MRLETKVHPYNGKQLIHEAQDNEEGVLIHINKEYASPNWHVIVALPHQCDEWEIAYGNVNDLDKVRAQLGQHIKELFEAWEYLGSEHYEKFVRELTNGTTDAKQETSPQTP